MTEERIKELATNWAWIQISNNIEECKQNLETLIRTVAAEARKEAIDMACEAVEPMHEGEWLPCARAVELIREAERLK